MQENHKQEKLLVTPSPHILDNISTRHIMLTVIVALAPTLLASVFIFGFRVLLLAGVTVASCVILEWLFCFVTKRTQSIGDLSAVVTGLILAYCLPVGLPLWMAFIGAFAAIVVTKCLFGGIGYNFANPALVGRIVLQLSFASAMTNYAFPQKATIDVLASATPLAAMQNGTLPIIDMLIGRHGGMLGETCSITLILGCAILVFTKIIKLTVPLVYVGGTFAIKLVLELIAGSSVGSALQLSFIYILGGGLLLGAIFMATDYTTSPYTTKGRIVFAVALAVLTVLFREKSYMAEGVSYSLLIMNLLVPIINSVGRDRPLGAPIIPRKTKEQKGESN